MECHTRAGRRRGRVILVLLLPLIAAACSSGPAAGVEITRTEYAEGWPFTVERGELACVDDAVVFTAGGTMYGVNGAAVRGGYPDVDPIRRTSPVIPPLKVSLAPLIEDGLALCR